jgi:hypothetical protein
MNMFFSIIIAIAVAILTQLILSPIFYALHPIYTPILASVFAGSLIVFVLDNFGFIVFAALALWIWKGLKSQETQNTYYGG